MEPNLLTYIIGGVALLIGVIAGKLLFARNTRKQVEQAELESKNIITAAQTNAETLKNQKLLEAKEKFLQLKAEHDKEVLERNRKLGESENRARQKEQTINQKHEQL